MRTRARHTYWQNLGLFCKLPLEEGFLAQNGSSVALDH
jgi:hypothetical protein